MDIIFSNRPLTPSTAFVYARHSTRAVIRPTRLFCVGRGSLAYHFFPRRSKICEPVSTARDCCAADWRHNRLLTRAVLYR